MRIAVTTDAENRVDLHAGRCHAFTIFEISGQTAAPIERRLNRFTAHARGECGSAPAGCENHAHHSHLPLLAALSDCRVLITRGAGPRLIADLAAHQIDCYACAVDCPAEAARLYALGRLPRVAHVPCGRH